MAVPDAQIGENLVALRGRMSQKDLAAAMKSLGWRWSQATVWSIEKGERPLRFAEASDLAQVLGVGLHALNSTSSLVTLEMRHKELNAAKREVIDAIIAYRSAQYRVADAADSIVRRGEKVPYAGVSVERDLRTSPEDLVKQYHRQVAALAVQNKAISDEGLAEGVKIRESLQERGVEVRRLPSPGQPFVELLLSLGPDVEHPEAPTLSDIFEGIPAERLERENWTFNYEMSGEAFERFTDLVFSDVTEPRV